MNSSDGGARTTQVGEFVQRQLGPDILDLAAGQPGPSSLPLDKIAAAAAHRFGSPGANPLMLQYGPEQGYTSFRRALAAFLSRHYGHAVDGDELMVTAGVSHGIDLACRTLASPGDIILVERPTYFLLQGIVDQCHLRTVEVPTDGKGVDVGALEALLEAGSIRPRLLYTVPVHSNPRGTVLPLERRRRLILLAHRYGFDILADEVYQLLGFPGAPPPPPPMRAVEAALFEEGLLTAPPAAAGDAPSGGGGGEASSAEAAAAALPDWSKEQQGRQGHGAKLAAGGGAAALARRAQAAASRVVSLGSWSKMLAPGMRLGWAEACPETLERLRGCGVLQSGGCIAPLPAAVAHSALELGLLEDHLSGHVRPALAARCGALCEEIDRQLAPLGCSYHKPAGGYFVWLQLPEQVDARRLLEFASARHGVRFAPGALSNGGPRDARLSFAFYSPEELRIAVTRLAAALREFMAQAQG